MIYEPLRTFLLGLDAVTAMVGDRVRPDRLHRADGVLDSIYIEIPDVEHQRHMGGGSGIAKTRARVVCVARTGEQSRRIAEAVRTNRTDPGTGLENFRGTVGGTRIDAAFLRNQTTQFIPESDGSEQGDHETAMDFDVWHTVNT